MTDNNSGRFDRRTFLKAGTGGLGLAAAGLTANTAYGAQHRGNKKIVQNNNSFERNSEGIPLRPLGKTGEKVPIICLGGHHLGRVEDDQQAINFVRYAVDNGVTFIDNAWEYHRGRSEKIVGRALRDGYRDKAFVMTKTHGRDKETTRKQIEESLRRLQVDTIDLCQVHEVIYRDDPRRFFAEDGGIGPLLQAQKEGKIRFIGFTGHKSPALFTEMMQQFDGWDTLQMPVNAFDPHYRSFIENVMPVAVEKQIAVIAMKTMGGGYLLRPGVISPEQALRFAWSQPVASVVSGMENMDLLKKNIENARIFEPMSEQEQKKLLEKTEPVAKDGEYEKFKTANTFDGWYGRTIHGNQPPTI
ncbi:General stress protein 69 [Anaerohalosphaera lusitana]|uniref:General stress protein 69 n=1 Tax=Anaerohalosphaera lusitana TaxID=1936003 RepID=A0A1U9NJ15_9BACT|nr:aldo/keto reductase [Anaerohalosphaera lusitana]AQT67728.1 General stress protein 69 [Anaerohalosphaera lusitana]